MSTSDSRELAALRHAGRRGHSAAPGGAPCSVGALLLRRAVYDLPPARADAGYLPAGYARFSAAGINPLDWAFWPAPGGWRLAAPARAPAAAVRAVLAQVAEAGPAAAGYVRIADVLVPAALGPGDRAALAQFDSERWE